MPKECEHIFVKIEVLSVKGAEARMIPAGYYCLRCKKTLFELTGIMGPGHTEWCGGLEADDVEE